MILLLFLHEKTGLPHEKVASLCFLCTADNQELSCAYRGSFRNPSP